MQVVFNFTYSLSDEDKYIIKRLMSDLKEKLNVEIEKASGKLDFEHFTEIDLVITDNYKTAYSIIEEETEVIYWFRGHKEEVQLYDENEELDLSVVVSGKCVGEDLPEKLQQNAVIIHPGVKEEFLTPLSDEKMIKTKNRRILIPGKKLKEQKIKQLVKSLEIIDKGCKIKAIIMKEANFEIETDVEYEFINPDSLETKKIEYTEADLALIISEEKNFELIPLEIMACKTPPIFICEEGVKEYITHNQNCRLLLNFDPKTLAITMLELLKNNIFAKNIAINASMTAKNYLWADTVKDWGQLIKEEVGMTEERLNRGIETKLPVEKEVQVQSGISEQLQRLLSSNNYGVEPQSDSVDIVIVNYNTRDEIEDCLESIQEHTEYDYQVIVIDNNSSDGSQEYLESLDWIELIENEENVGYARACNQGIKAGNGEYVLLLNSDIKVTEGWLEPLVDVAQADEVAVVGPKLVNEAEKIVGAGVTELDETCSPRGWKEVDSGDKYNDIEECVSVGGAAYLIKRELIPEIGFFDERYFFYFEEADYSLRAREKGYKVMYCPDSRIYHLHEGSLKEGDEAGREKRNEYFNESQELFKEKWNHLISPENEAAQSIVALGITPWKFRYQRSQQILSRLSSDYRILYVNNSNASERGWLNYEEKLKLKKIDSNLHILSPPSSELVYNLVQEETNCKLLAQVINDILDRLNLRNPILWLDTPYWAPVMDYLSPTKIVYNCMDKFEEFKGLSEKADLITEYEEEILNRADVVLATSQSLLEKTQQYNENVNLVPNAADLDHFGQVNEQELEIPAELEDIKQPIAGFYGAIAEWFDVDLVAKLAKQEPELAIVLIGNVTVKVNELRKYDNVYLLGEKPYAELPNYLQEFDVCIIPFCKNELTLSTDPVKLYEYLAAGKPVVSVDLPEVEKFSEVIEIAKNEEEFCEKISKLCTDGDMETELEQIQELLAGNDWEDRVETIKELIAEVKSEAEEEKGEKIEVAKEDLKEERKNDANQVEIEGSILEEDEGIAKENELGEIDEIDSRSGETLVLGEERKEEEIEESEVEIGWFKNLWLTVKTKFKKIWDWLKGI